MTHYLFNFSQAVSAKGRPARELAVARLRVKMWDVDESEPHAHALAPGDLTLIYLGDPDREFIGRAELISVVRDWTPSEARVSPGDSSRGVLLGRVEEWDPPVPMDAVLPRIDPTGSNPYVQANAKEGFPNDVVRITAHEYESVLAVRAENFTSTA